MSNQTLETDILEQSIIGFHTYLKDFFPKDVPVIMQPGRLYLRALARQKKEVQYPFFATSLNTISEAKDGYNNFALKKLGFRANLNSSGDFFYNYRLKNVIANFTVGFYTNDYKEMFTFIKNWQKGDGILNFTLKQDENTEIGITVLRNKDLVVPPEQIEEVGEFFNMESSCDLRTYVGDAIKVPVINKVKLNITTYTVETIDETLN